MSQSVVATPSEVEDELNKRLAMTDEEIINNRFQNAWDLRAADFNCQSDSMTGNFYMIDKVKKFNKESKTEFLKDSAALEN